MDRLTLPLPARGIWLRVRSLLEPALERLGPEAGSWKIGGGTRYERVRMYTDGDVGFVETRTRHGADRKLTVDPTRIDELFEANGLNHYLVDPTRIDELFEANGLNHYLPQTGARPVDIRERMRTAFRKGAEFVHDTASGATPGQTRIAE